MRGGSRSSRTLRWDAVDAGRATDERARGGRRRRVVLAPRRWCQVPGKQSFPGATAARKPFAGKSTLYAVNHCAGKAGCSPLNLYARVRILLCILHTRSRVQRAPGLPCALFVFFEGGNRRKPRTHRAAGARRCARIMITLPSLLIGSPSFRGDAKHRTTTCDCTSENLEIPRCAIAHRGPRWRVSRNDRVKHLTHAPPISRSCSGCPWSH
jgi:hypothetical protein